MDDIYTKQLRADSLATLAPITAVLTVLLCLLAIVAISPDQFISLWSLWLAIGGSVAVAQIVRRLASTEGWQTSAGILYVAAHMVFITLIIGQMWQPGSVLPFLFAIFVVVSGMIIDVVAGFVAWLASTLLLLLGVYSTGLLDWSTFFPLLVPILLNLALATVSFLAAVDWKIALESVSELQMKAQTRRDELFAIQEELSMTNAKLKYLNDQLEIARQAAVDERDMRTRFMNNVSHELRTPLNAIVNFAYILFQGGRGPINENQSDYLQRIEQAGRHLLNVLNDLLDLARIESGEFRMHLELADLRALCDEAMDSTRGLILEKEEELELVRDYPEVWPSVQVDTMRFKQALINLLGNAAKYTDRGHIALRVRQMEDNLQIMVEDTGEGIAPKYHEVIFQEFRQVDDTAARRRVGTGLGLPITRHLVERHGGTLTLDSDLGRGSAFIITLPLVQEENAAGVTAVTTPEAITSRPPEPTGPVAAQV